MPNIQLPENVFFALVRWHCFDQHDDVDRQLIIDALERKLEAWDKRRQYGERIASQRKDNLP